MEVCLKEAEDRQKTIETSLEHVEAKASRLSQEFKDLKVELSLKKGALDAAQ